MIENVPQGSIRQKVKGKVPSKLISRLKIVIISKDWWFKILPQRRQFSQTIINKWNPLKVNLLIVPAKPISFVTMDKKCHKPRELMRVCFLSTYNFVFGDVF